GIGKFYALEDDRPVLVAQGVTRGRVTETDRGGDVAGVDLLDLLALVGVHLEEPPDALLLPLDRVVDVRAGVHDARVDPQEGQRADVGVGHDLEGQRGEGRVVRRATLLLLARVRIGADHGRNVDRRWQQVDDGVEQRLHALVLEGGAAGDRHDLHGERARA